MVVKDPSEVLINFAFAFPDVYEVGMSHLGMKILYHLINEREIPTATCFCPVGGYGGKDEGERIAAVCLGNRGADCRL